VQLDGEPVNLAVECDVVGGWVKTLVAPLGRDIQQGETTTLRGRVRLVAINE
jgi:hypothetical protein